MGDAADDLRELEEDMRLAHDMGECGVEGPCPICDKDTTPLANSDGKPAKWKEKRDASK